MGSTTAGLSDDDSATISDADNATTETDIDTDGEDDDVESPPPSDSSPFQEGEKVLAQHGHWLYDAKVQRIEFGKKECRYYVHYLGWNKSWDEWVCVDRLRKYTDENIQEQQALHKKYGREKMTRVSQAKPKNSTVTRGKKRKNEAKTTAAMEKLVNVQIPPTLKKQLVDDCEFITRLGKLVKLPRSPNVDEILSKYLDYRSKKDAMIADSVAEILSGLRCYFDRALPAMLLYKSERQQYQEAVGENDTPSLVYGAEHLLRLFVKLPEILSYAKIEEQTSRDLQEKLQDFLKFLQKNQNAFFLSTYETPEGFDTSTEKQDG